MGCETRWKVGDQPNGHFMSDRILLRPVDTWACGGAAPPDRIRHFLPVITISISYLPMQGRTSVRLDPAWNEIKRKGMEWNGGHLIYPIANIFG